MFLPGLVEFKVGHKRKTTNGNNIRKGERVAQKTGIALVSDLVESF